MIGSAPFIGQLFNWIERSATIDSIRPRQMDQQMKHMRAIVAHRAGPVSRVGEPGVNGDSNRSGCKQRHVNRRAEATGFRQENHSSIISFMWTKTPEIA